MFSFIIWGFVSSSSFSLNFAGFAGFFVDWVVGVFVARCTEILGGFVDCVCWLNSDSILSKKEGNMRYALGLPVLTNDMSESRM